MLCAMKEIIIIATIIYNKKKNIYIYIFPAKLSSLTPMEASTVVQVVISLMCFIHTLYNKLNPTLVLIGPYL